jgi:hypothetical protein
VHPVGSYCTKDCRFLSDIQHLYEFSIFHACVIKFQMTFLSLSINSFFTPKSLFFNVACLRSNLCVVRPTERHQKLLSGIHIGKEGTSSSQCRGTYHKRINVIIRKCWWNTCKIPCLLSRPHPLWYLIVSYEG